MITNGYAVWVLGAAVSCVGCSGSYQVGSDMSWGGVPSAAGTGKGGSSPSASSASGSSAGGSSAGGASGDPAVTASGGTEQAGAAAVGGIVDPPATSRCGFTPATTGTGPSPTATPDLVLARIQLFLDAAAGSSAPATSVLPSQASAAWAAGQATAILDDHLAKKTEAPGLARFLTAWLRLPLGAKVEVKAAHTWALKLLDPQATLSTLLAEPTGQPHRLGILTDPQVLAARPGISGRGGWIEEKLFCSPVPASPPSIPALDPTPVPGVTRRDKLESAVSPAACNACHTLMDPTGDALEHFDAMGNYRDVDSGAAVDSAASISQPMSISFNSFDDLAPALAVSCPVAQCFAQAVTNDASTAAKVMFSEADANQVANAFADGGFSIRELVKAIVSSPSFMR